jgi:hypothetical protein
MIRWRKVVAVAVLCGMPTGAGAQVNSKEQASDANAVLSKARDTYRSLPGYHFERALIVHEAGRDGGRNIAELTLTSATEDPKTGPDGTPFPPISADRLRLGLKTKQGETLQVCDGRTCWSYTSQNNEYMTGQTFRDVNASVGGAMLIGLHLSTFSSLTDGAIQNATILRQEEIEVGTERRNCYVVDGLTPRPILAGPGRSQRPAAPPTLGPWWLVSTLTLLGLAEVPRETRYSPWLDPKENADGEPTRITLWIDANTHLIVRSKMSAKVYRNAGPGPQTVDPVDLTVTEGFTIASGKAPSEESFRFTPPAGAKEVPNAASRRKKN